MRYIWQHIQTIIENYNGGVKLSHYLKNYYKLHPKLGSRDRKILSEMAYCWYRCSKGLPGALPFEEKIKACLFLCETTTHHSNRFLPEHWQAKKELPTEERLEALKEEGINFSADNLVSFTPLLSQGISASEWLRSILQQPSLFIRIREKKNEIERILTDNALPYSYVSASCMALPNSSAVDKLLPEQAYVVQDASSQETGAYFQPRAREDWWDCCSGAGGKSLLLMDQQPRVHLTVSDQRSSILSNLTSRFKLYGLRPPEQFVLDVTKHDEVESSLYGRLFDNIICDVPCSGSGTWARTPEQLYYFKESYINDFSERQREITANVIPHLKTGGRLLYITCSIFKEENEEVVAELVKKGMQLEKQELINGIEKSADSMFIAVLQK